MDWGGAAGETRLLEHRQTDATLQMSPSGAGRAQLLPPPLQPSLRHKQVLSVVSSAGLQSGRRAHCFRAETPPAQGTPNTPASDPQTLVHANTQIHAETRSQAGVGRSGQDSPPGGAVRAANQPGRLQLPVPPLRPAQATPPTGAFAANPTVTTTCGPAPSRPQNAPPLPHRRPVQFGPYLDPPHSALEAPPLVTTPPRFQRPAPSAPCSLMLRPAPGSLRPLRSGVRGSCALYRQDSHTSVEP